MSAWHTCVVVCEHTTDKNTIKMWNVVRSRTFLISTRGQTDLIMCSWLSDFHGYPSVHNNSLQRRIFTQNFLVTQQDKSWKVPTDCDIPIKIYSEPVFLSLHQENLAGRFPLDSKRSISTKKLWNDKRVHQEKFSKFCRSRGPSLLWFWTNPNPEVVMDAPDISWRFSLR